MFQTFSQGFQGYYPSLFGKPSQLKAFTCKTFLYKELTMTVRVLGQNEGKKKEEKDRLLTKSNCKHFI